MYIYIWLELVSPLLFCSVHIAPTSKTNIGGSHMKTFAGNSNPQRVVRNLNMMVSKRNIVFHRLFRMPWQTCTKNITHRKNMSLSLSQFSYYTNGYERYYIYMYIYLYVYSLNKKTHYDHYVYIYIYISIHCHANYVHVCSSVCIPNANSNLPARTLHQPAQYLARSWPSISLTSHMAGKWHAICSWKCRLCIWSRDVSYKIQ